MFASDNYVKGDELLVFLASTRCSRSSFVCSPSVRRLNKMKEGSRRFNKAQECSRSLKKAQEDSRRLKKAQEGSRRLKKA